MSATLAVRDRPILMSGPMVRATLRERDAKTQTRRVAKLPADVVIDNWGQPFRCLKIFGGWHREEIACPYGTPGDRLWVRETFFDHGPLGDSPTAIDERIEYRATEWERKGDGDAGGWSPSIHMPRWASRLTLELTGVCVERVQDISDEDIRAEGSDQSNDPEHWRSENRASYAALWDSLNAKRGYGWGVNPWVWVLEFRRLAS